MIFTEDVRPQVWRARRPVPDCSEKGGPMNTGLLIVRAVIGLVLAGHGVQKLFGWFGGSGLTGTGKAMGAVGYRPGTLFAFVAGATEAVRGVLLGLGLLAPPGGSAF